MKNYIFLTISLIVLWSCGQQEDAIVDFQEPATNGWTEIPVGIISMEELTSTPGAISFTDVVNNRFTLIDGQFVCAQDYPETTFQEVGISNLMEYQGYLIDNDESQVFGHEGRVFYANKNGKGNAGNTDLDCSFLTSTKNKRCIDADGNEAFERCTTTVFVCISHATGFNVDISQDCFGCGGDINGIPDTEDPEGPSGGSICF